jgi:hypothetical protein
VPFSRSDETSNPNIFRPYLLFVVFKESLTILNRILTFNLKCRINLLLYHLYKSEILILVNRDQVLQMKTQTGHVEFGTCLAVVIVSSGSGIVLDEFML